MLSVEPQDRLIIRQEKKKLIRIYNRDSASNLAFKIKTTNINALSANPASGVVLPQANCEVTISINIDREFQAKIQVSSTKISDGESLDKIFKERDKSQLSNVVLEVKKVPDLETIYEIEQSSKLSGISLDENLNNPGSSRRSHGIAIHNSNTGAGFFNLAASQSHPVFNTQPAAHSNHSSSASMKESAVSFRSTAPNPNTHTINNSQIHNINNNFFQGHGSSSMILPSLSNSGSLCNTNAAYQNLETKYKQQRINSEKLKQKLEITERKLIDAYRNTHQNRINRSLKNGGDDYYNLTFNNILLMVLLVFVLGYFVGRVM